MSADGFQVQFVQTRSGGTVAVGKIGLGPIVLVTPASLPTSDFQHFRNLEATGVVCWIPGLAEEFTCVTYDNLGAGLSTRDVYDYSAEGLLSEFEAVAEQFEGLRFAVIGWGPASHAAIRYVVEHPDRVSCLVLATTWSRGSQYTGTANFAAYRRVLEADWLTASEYYARVTLGLRGMEAQATGAWVRSVTSLTAYTEYLDRMSEHDVTELLPSVSCPTLVTCTEENFLYPLEGPRSVAAAIPGSQLRVFQGRAEWLAMARDFIRQHVPDSKTLPGTYSAGRPSAASLSSREREVVALISAGKTNREIAEALVISETTAARHVHNILVKLELSNRAEAATWWAEHRER